MAQHWEDVEKSQLAEISYRLNIICVVYALSGGLAKTSVFLQLKTFFAPGPMRDAAWWVITISLIANAMAYITIMMLYMFTCLPREKIWHAEVKGRCMDWDGVSIAVGILNTMSDIETFLVPVWCVLRLHTDVWTKLGALAVFASGALAAIIGLLGMCWRLRVLEGGDYTWLLSELSLICMAELTMVLVTAGCPILKNAQRLSLRDKTRAGCPVVSPLPTSLLSGKLPGSDITQATTRVYKTHTPAPNTPLEALNSRDATISLGLDEIHGDLSVNGRLSRNSFVWLRILTFLDVGSQSEAAALQECTLRQYQKDF
ncbi:hypothetical protein BKA63DRAFT_503639 [Paraphoma chrysanthemicola]|nr:hypothetical protein BKA63DRAFT_503639 [Paraphoma chrysanthemicola]